MQPNVSTLKWESTKNLFLCAAKRMKRKQRNTCRKSMQFKNTCTGIQQQGNPKAQRGLIDEIEPDELIGWNKVEYLRAVFANHWLTKMMRAAIITRQMQETFIFVKYFPHRSVCTNFTNHIVHHIAGKVNICIQILPFLSVFSKIISIITKNSNTYSAH